MRENAFAPEMLNAFLNPTLGKCVSFKVDINGNQEANRFELLLKVATREKFRNFPSIQDATIFLNSKLN